MKSNKKRGPMFQIQIKKPNHNYWINDEVLEGITGREASYIAGERESKFNIGVENDEQITLFRVKRIEEELC